MVARKYVRWALLGLLAATLVAAAKDRELTIRDYVGRGFAPDLVNYVVEQPLPAQPDFSLLDAQGRALPYQVSPGPDARSLTLSFVTDLPPNGTVRFTLQQPGKAPAPATAVAIAKEDDGSLRLTNGRLAVRVPAAGEKTFAEPVSANTLPAPLLGFRSGNGAWLGAGKVLTTRLVKAFRVKTSATGPVFAEVTYELEWAAGGYYRAEIRVVDQVPVVKFREEFDLGKLDGTDFWELNLATGWTPDRTEIAQPWGNGSGQDSGRVDALGALKAKGQVLVNPTRACLGLFNDADRKEQPGAYTLAGYVPLNRGDWRRMNTVPLATNGPNDVRLQFPMSVRDATWPKEITSEASPFSMQEHDPALPRTYGRRRWGLVLGEPVYPNRAQSQITFQARWSGVVPLEKFPGGPVVLAWVSYGVVGLDRYKDFILEWPDTKVAYPRLYRTAKMAATPEDLANLQEKHLRWLANYLISCPDVSHHVLCDSYSSADLADGLLSWPELPAEKRQELRAQLALCTYLYEDADVINYGNGNHPGNPNMGTARFMSAPTFLALLPDHPLATRWRDHIAAYTEYKMATQIAPGGAYIEYGAAYHMHGYARTTNGLPGLVKAGLPPADVNRLYAAYHRPDWDYYLNLLTPVERRWGVRMIPGLANSPPGNTETFMDAAGSFLGQDPEFAANLRWAWEANGKPTGYNASLAPVALAPKEPVLGSRLFPGFGLILRAHQGPDETYLLLRSGFNWSHWYVDSGHFVLVSRGAPLVPFQPYQYHRSANQELDLYNTVRFGHPANLLPYGWPDGNILAHAFTPTADYAWVSTGYPDWFAEPGIKPEFRPPGETGDYLKLTKDYPQQPGAFTWDRQVLFLKGKTGKSPNYFVFRDTTTGPGRFASFWFLNLLGQAADLKTEGNHLAVNTEWSTKLDVFFAAPAAVKPEFFDEQHPRALNNNLSKSLPKDASRNWVGDKEQHVIIRVPGAPGAGRYWVLYPREEKEPLPTIQALGESVLKITHPEGTDYVFLAPTHTEATVEKVTFAGTAGTVRVTPAEVTLLLTDGTGRVGYQGRVLEGVAPLSETLPVAQAKPEVQRKQPPASAVAWDVPKETGEKLAAGVTRTAVEGATVYVVDAPAPVTFADATVQLEASRALVSVKPDGQVRFVVPDAAYARLTVGTVGVRGLGPFDLTFTDVAITGKVDGAQRSLATTWPEKLTRPMYHLDGLRYFAGFADEPSFGKGMKTPQLAIAFAVGAGPHEVAVSEWTYPPLPPLPERTRLK